MNKQQFVPNYQSERTFRKYEDPIAKIVNAFPKPVEWTVKEILAGGLRPNTFASKLKSASVSYKMYNWTSKINRNRFITELGGEIVVSLSVKAGYVVAGGKDQLRELNQHPVGEGLTSLTPGMPTIGRRGVFNVLNEIDGHRIDPYTVAYILAELCPNCRLLMRMTTEQMNTITNKFYIYATDLGDGTYRLTAEGDGTQGAIRPEPTEAEKASTGVLPEPIKPLQKEKWKMPPPSPEVQATIDFLFPKRKKL